MSQESHPEMKKSLTRRDFILKASSALAGMSLVPGLLKPGPAHPNIASSLSTQKIRIGVVGGGFGSDFYWHEHPNCIVQAVSDLREDRRKRLMDIYRCSNVYNSLEELIKDQSVDAVAVFTGAPDHVQHCTACLKSGKHVISAVPAAISLEQAEELLDCIKATGLTYMMAETSFYHQIVISARRFYREGQFGEIFYSEAEYLHPGMEYTLWYDAQGQPTWRHGFPPMLYPTHCTSYLVGVTGERLTEVTATGWGDKDPISFPNVYKNPFWSEAAFFKTDRGHSFRVMVFWRGAFGGCERGQWYGSRMSLFGQHPNGTAPVIRRISDETEKDDAGFARRKSSFETYAVPEWWKTDMLPEPLRHSSGHDGSHTFLTHEFIDALVNKRKPAIDIYEALAFTVPGIVAHKSALEGGAPMKIPSFDRLPRP
ncbi:MAG: Gfo/Idh/MocA family oxidoreductase [Candidatus Aminicenantes bacterium]|nr:Gfo/Idh/MocA family oxidoreductase [Candidatus Aminicenantes bacterium]